jgi:hypothetical protein
VSDADEIVVCDVCGPVVLGFLSALSTGWPRVAAGGIRGIDRRKGNVGKSVCACSWAVCVAPRDGARRGSVLFGKRVVA